MSGLLALQLVMSIVVELSIDQATISKADWPFVVVSLVTETDRLLSITDQVVGTSDLYLIIRTESSSRLTQATRQARIRLRLINERVRSTRSATDDQ